MFDPYKILELTSAATKEEAKTAYRRLAMLWHPDRVEPAKKALAEARFKEIKGAWEMIDNGWVSTATFTPSPSAPPHRHWTKPEPAWPGYADAYEEEKRKAEAARPKASPFRAPPVPPRKLVEAWPPLAPTRENIGDFTAQVSMADAFNGFIVEVAVKGKKVQVKMPQGVPHGIRNTFQVGDDDITVTTFFNKNVYEFIGMDNALREAVIVNSQPGLVYRTKDLGLRIEVHENEIRRGTTLQLKDFLGAPYTVKVPAGFNARRDKLRVEDRGYVDWYASHSQAGHQRGDVIITIIPTEGFAPQNLLLR